MSVSDGSCSTPRDPTECHDLAAEHPDKLQQLIGLWWHEAGRYQALPLENRTAVEILTTDRPQLSKPRDRYIYYPGGAEVPESVAPNIRNRSYTIAVEVAIDTEAAEGVLFAQGSRFGGHALCIKDRKLKYVYDWVGLFEQIVEATEPVTDDHPGERPWAFIGDTIHKAILDVSGQPFVDLATEARMAFARDRPRWAPASMRAPLASWNDTGATQAIVEFVGSVTRDGDDICIPSCRAGRGVRQRRDVVVREADANRARIHPQTPGGDGRR
jgi:hypothetical protein